MTITDPATDAFSEEGDHRGGRARTSLRALFSFPDPVNEKAARTVAAGVAIGVAITLATGAWWASAPLAVGFLARTLSGPRFSPLGLLATRVVAPRLGTPTLTPGPPKRFAQSIGVIVTTAAAVAWFGFEAEGVCAGLLVTLLAFATLESAFGFCAGCWLFARLIRAGLLPESACEACADLSIRRAS